MPPDSKHRLGAVLMWCGLLVAAVGGLYFAPVMPVAGAAAFVIGLAAAIVGAALKKKYCPRCRRGACDLADAPPGSPPPKPPE